MQRLVTRRSFLAASAALPPAFSSLRLFGQDPSFSVDVGVVNVLATVHDKNGAIVRDLGKDDFTLSEDGRTQKIVYFSRETDLPLTLGLLVDTSMSQRRLISEERSASFHFVDRILREDKDQVFVIHFDHDTELLQDLTSSKKNIQKALDELELAREDRPQMQRRQGGSGGGYPGGGGGYPGAGGGRPRGGGQRQAGTTLYDAILLASDELMRKQKGRKALILLTDGVDNGSKSSMTQAIASAQRSDTLVYSILFADEAGNQPMLVRGGGMGRGRMGGGGYPRRFPNVDVPDGKKVLQRISAETGGGFFQVTRKLGIDAIYDRINEELRSQYSLGYTSDKKDSVGFRTIKLAVSRPGAVVQTRQGYYANGS